MTLFLTDCDCTVAGGLLSLVFVSLLLLVCDSPVADDLLSLAFVSFLLLEMDISKKYLYMLLYIYQKRVNMLAGTYLPKILNVYSWAA